MHLSTYKAASLTLVLVVETLGSAIPTTPSRNGTTRSLDGNPISAVADRVRDKVKAANLMDEATFNYWDKELDTAVQSMDVDDSIMLELVGDWDLSDPDTAADQVFQRLIQDGIFVEMRAAAEMATGTSVDMNDGKHSELDPVSTAHGTVVKRWVFPFLICKHL